MTILKRRRRLASLGVSFWLAASLSACSNAPSPSDRPGSAPLEPDLVKLNPSTLPQGEVRLEQVRRSILPEELQVTGRIAVNENRTSRVGAVAGGRVVKVMANVGDRVEAGTALAQITSNEVHDARSEYAKALAELRQKRAELEFASNARDRANRLHELKANSLEQVQRAETDLSSAELAVAIAQAEVTRVEESLRHLGVDLQTAVDEYTKPEEARDQFEKEELIPVRSPIEGTVMQRMVSPGMVVTPSNDLFVISDLSVLWVIAEVPERNLRSLRTGVPVSIAVQAYTGRVFPGKIALIGSSLDPNTRTVQVRCEASGRDGLLKPEMYATIRIEVGEGREGTVIPLNSVQDVDGQSVVFVRESEDRFRAREVRLGRQTGNMVEVIDGVQPGESIATLGSFLLKSELLKRRFSVE